MSEVADIAGRLLGTEVPVRTIPARLLRGVGRTVAPVLPMVDDMSRMIAWMQTGRYVADTTRQGQVFGPVPTAEDAVARLLTSHGHPVTA
jgi:hypothetical protein